jgi:hypothetical protein
MGRPFSQSETSNVDHHVTIPIPQNLRTCGRHAWHTSRLISVCTYGIVDFDHLTSGSLTSKQFEIQIMFKCVCVCVCVCACVPVRVYFIYLLLSFFKFYHKRLCKVSYNLHVMNPISINGGKNHLVKLPLRPPSGRNWISVITDEPKIMYNFQITPDVKYLCNQG